MPNDANQTTTCGFPLCVKHGCQSPPDERNEWCPPAKPVAQQTIQPQLPHEIAALCRVGYRRTAAEELAAQRRITFDEALALVDAWRAAYGY